LKEKFVYYKKNKKLQVFNLSRKAILAQDMAELMIGKVNSSNISSYLKPIYAMVDKL
jgi:hypothetical protein